MNELALFAGAGGGILGGLLLGWRTVCAVEIDPFARSVLLARQRDGLLEPFPVWDDVRTFDGEPWRGDQRERAWIVAHADREHGAARVGHREGGAQLRAVGARERAGVHRSPWLRGAPPHAGVVDGMASRLDRTRALGNGQVPAVVALAWTTLTEAP